ncbi:uncharacterized protein TNCV_2225381 [Trichonephila clavipes]|nr:uncharacterized protein TNCV_2225381 [Trichonephila clavipes]
MCTFLDPDLTNKMFGSDELLKSESDCTFGRGSLGVKISDRCWHVTSSSSVPLKTRCVGERCKLNLSRAETSSRWCGVVVRSAKSPRVAEQCDVNIQSINQMCGS